ncbi:hypothetical protein K438DRAFT_2147935 [Mycena galopus ATCC 62051]|nr:hypothetical protein K438DRAFT_2147935 [Mycena galopus ATCC 62051]
MRVEATLQRRKPMRQRKYLPAEDGDNLHVLVRIAAHCQGFIGGDMARAHLNLRFLKGVRRSRKCSNPRFGPQHARYYKRNRMALSDRCLLPSPGGNIRLPVISALATKNVAVILLARPSSSAKAIPLGTYGRRGNLHYSRQKPLVDAAKLAAKLFVPSEYTMPSRGHTEGIFGVKNEMTGQDLSIHPMVQTGLFPYLTANCKILGHFVSSTSGALAACEDWLLRAAVNGSSGGDAPSSFMTSILQLAGNLSLFLQPESIPQSGLNSPCFSLTIPTGAKSVVAKGETPIIPGFAAHASTTLPPSELNNCILRLEGDRSTLNDLTVLFKTSVEHLPVDTGAGSTCWDEVQLEKVEGTGENAAGSALTNALWPGHQCQTIKDLHKL